MSWAVRCMGWMEPWECTFLDVESFVIKNRNATVSYSQYRTQVWWEEKGEYGAKEEKERKGKEKKRRATREESKVSRKRSPKHEA